MATTKRSTRKRTARKSARKSARKTTRARRAPTYTPNNAHYSDAPKTRSFTGSLTFPAPADGHDMVCADDVEAYRHTNGVLGIQFGCQGWGREDEWRSGGAKHEKLLAHVLEGADDKYISAESVTQTGATYQFGASVAAHIAELSKKKQATDENLLAALKEHLDMEYIHRPVAEDAAATIRARISAGIDLTVDWLAALLPA